MAQTGYTPIALYYSTTASAAPAAGNLTNGELAINITDKKLYAKDNAGNVFVLADASSGGTTATNLAGGAAGSVPYQSGASTTTFLSLGTAAQVLQVNAGATAPEWVSSTGTGNVVRASSPTLTTPTLGVASATSINKVAITAPATGSTLTIEDGKTLTASNTLTFTGTDSSSVAFGTGGTVAYTSNNLSVFAATTSAQLAGVISDETGSGSLVFGTSPTIATPTITTSATVPLLIGGTGTTSTLTLRSTSGVGTTGADIIFQVGNNGATEAMRVLNSGYVGIGTSTPAGPLDIAATASGLVRITTTTTGTAPGFYSRQSRGSLSVPAAVILNDVLGRFSCGGYGTTNYQTAGTIQVFAAETFSDTSSAGYITISTTPSGSVTASERMRIDSAGNVGIGNASPGTRLHVTNAAGTYNATADNSVAIYVNSTTAAATGNFQGLQFAATSGNSLNSTFTIGISSPATGYSPDLVFSQRTGVSTYAERMRIDSSGNVGIGTASPPNKVSVYVSDSSVYAPTTPVAAQLRIENQSNTTGSVAEINLFSRNASAVSGAHVLASVSTASDNNNDFVIQQRTGPATWVERLRLTSAGFLGIGTTAAARPLHVASTNPTAFFDRDGGNEATLGFRSSRGTLASPTQSLANDTLGTLGAFGYTNSGAYTAQGVAGISFLAAENLTTTARGGIITFNTVTTGTTTYTERMRIDGSGNLAIGSTSATFRLDVTSAAVSGDVAVFRTTAATNALIAFSDNTPTNVGPRFGSAGNNLVFLTNTSGSASERMRLTGAGYLGIGTTAPARPLHVASVDPGIFIDRPSGNPGAIGLRSSRGTLTAPTQTLSADQLGAISAFGYTDSSAYSAAGVSQIFFIAAENFTSTAQGSYMYFTTTPTGSTTAAERLRITAAGNVVVTGTGGLGYGTGSGGAVTQATSRTTGVTLNKTNGAITLVSAAGTTTWQTFTVTNSTVAATDTIIVNQKSGTDLNEIHVTAVAAGSFNISFRTTGGTTTEQPVFNFAVIKAVVA